MSSPGTSHRLSLLLPNLRGGGAERVSIDLADALADLGHSVEFVLLQEKGELLSQVIQRHKVYGLKAKSIKNSFWPLVKYLRQRRPDALIAAMWPLSFIAPLAAKISGFKGPVLVVEHCSLSNQYKEWGKGHGLLLRASLSIGFRLADVRAGVSRGVADDVARLAVYTTSKISVLYNPIPLRLHSSFEAMERAESFWSKPKGKRILTVGSLKAQKNHRLLLEAFAHLDDPDACLMIVGQGSLEESLRALADELQIADRVVFAGFHVDPMPFYRTADLFVLSSDHEGLPTVLIEALSCGLPVVSTDCPSGPSEILEDGLYGILTPVGDAPALAQGMREALSAQWNASELVRRAGDFSPEKAARQYLEVLGFR